MDRRTFSLNAAGLAGALAFAGASAPGRVRAQGDAPVEGRDFKTLPHPVSVPANGKIELIEFFWYGCPHCFAFEPTLQAWVASLPDDVRFRRVPVGFDARKELHQRLYYTWEAMGLVERMHMKTFTRFHVQRRPIDSERDLLDFAREAGLDVDKAAQAWNSFGVQSRCREAIRLEDDYDIDQTPELGIGGRFVALVQPKVLVTAERLLDRIRHGG